MQECKRRRWACQSLRAFKLILSHHLTKWFYPKSAYVRKVVGVMDAGGKSRRDAQQSAQPNITLLFICSKGADWWLQDGVNCFICKYQIMLSFQLNQVNLKFRFRSLVTCRCLESVLQSYVYGSSAVMMISAHWLLVAVTHSAKVLGRCCCCYCRSDEVRS